MRVIPFARNAAILIAIVCGSVVAQQSTGYLKTKVNPGRAGVFVDGKYVGPAGNFGMSQKYAVAAGDHEIRLAEPRYEEVVTKVTIHAGKTTELAQTMKPLKLAEPPFGVLRTISSDKFAAVYVNGRYMGHADEFSNPVQGLQLNPGQYTVKIVPLGSATGHEEQVKIEANKVSIARLQK